MGVERDVVLSQAGPIGTPVQLEDGNLVGDDIGLGEDDLEAPILLAAFLQPLELQFKRLEDGVVVERDDRVLFGV